MIDKALASLVPNAEWIVEGDTYDGIQWLDQDKTKPTEEEVTNEVARLNAELVANAYKYKRQQEYKPLAEQLDMQYHDSQDGTETWLNHIKEVKAKYPKGDE
tara:strand:- start:330 stop:635 length:306 start_codon:yes stop_codon:yes gene_type:complete